MPPVRRKRVGVNEVGLKCSTSVQRRSKGRRKQKPRGPRSVMAEYFEYKFDDKTGEKFAVCKICLAGDESTRGRMVTIKMKDANTKGIHKHLLHHHRAEYYRVHPEHLLPCVTEMGPLGTVEELPEFECKPAMQMSTESHILPDLEFDSTSNECGKVIDLIGDEDRQPECGGGWSGSGKDGSAGDEDGNGGGGEDGSRGGGGGEDWNGGGGGEDGSSGGEDGSLTPEMVSSSVERVKREVEVGEARTLKDFFAYRVDLNTGEKYATCKICEIGDESKPGKIVMIKMKNSNTKGVQRHLHSLHKDEYYQVHPEEPITESSGSEFKGEEPSSVSTEQTFPSEEDMKVITNILTDLGVSRGRGVGGDPGIEEGGNGSSGASSSAGPRYPKRGKVKLESSHRMSEYFDYDLDEKTKVKFATCKLCLTGSESTPGKLVTIKMKDCNTKGVHHHLMHCHQTEYCKVYPDKLSVIARKNAKRARMLERRLLRQMRKIRPKGVASSQMTKSGTDRVANRVTRNRTDESVVGQMREIRPKGLISSQMTENRTESVVNQMIEIRPMGVVSQMIEIRPKGSQMRELRPKGVDGQTTKSIMESVANEMRRSRTESLVSQMTKRRTESVVSQMRKIRPKVIASQMTRSTETVANRVTNIKTECVVNEMPESVVSQKAKSGTESVVGEKVDICEQSGGTMSNPPPHGRKLRSRRKTRSDGGKCLEDYFEYVLGERLQEKYATCKLCLRGTGTECGKVVTIKMKNSNTKGVHNHLLNCHMNEYYLVHPDKIPVVTELGIAQLQVNEQEKESLDVYAWKQSPEQPESFQDGFEKRLVDWLAMKYLPFSFFEDNVSGNLFSYLNARAVVPETATLENRVCSRFAEMQKTVMELVRKNISNVAFTIDGWTSIGEKTFHRITAHFIDDSWQFQSLAVDFVPSRGSDTGSDIANALCEITRNYGLSKKIQSITDDTASANVDFMALEPNCHDDFKPEDQYFRCFGSIVDLAVEDVMEFLSGKSFEDVQVKSHDSSDDFDDINAVDKLRSLFMRLQQSEALRIKFHHCCVSTSVKLSVLPVAEETCKWTFVNDMISAAVKVIPALNALCDENHEMNVFRIAESEWNIILNISNFLKNFGEFVKILSGNECGSLSVVIEGFNVLVEKVETAVENMENKSNLTEKEEHLLQVFQSASNKLLRHYKLTNWIYCAAFVLDPRHKKKADGREMWNSALDKFESIYCNKYYNPFLSLDAFDDGEPEHIGGKGVNHSLDLSGMEWRKELDEYYKDKLADSETNVLEWWSYHGSMYPCLATMARDVLCIPATVVPARQLYSRSGLEGIKQWEGMDEGSARNLLCLNSWVTSELYSVLSQHWD